MLELAGVMAVPLCVIGIYNWVLGDDPYMVETALGGFTVLFSLSVLGAWLACLIGYVAYGRRGFQIAFWCFFAWAIFYHPDPPIFLLQFTHISIFAFLRFVSTFPDRYVPLIGDIFL